MGLAAGFAGSAATGCGSDEEERAAARRESRFRARAARDTAALIASYDATAQAHPSLARELRPLRADLVLHLKAFGGAGDTAASPSPSGKPPGGPPAVPSKPDAAKRALADAERGAADARARDLLDAPPELARLLASVAAAGAGHVLLLRS